MPLDAPCFTANASEPSEVASYYSGTRFKKSDLALRRKLLYRILPCIGTVSTVGRCEPDIALSPSSTGIGTPLRGRSGFSSEARNASQGAASAAGDERWTWTLDWQT